MAGRSFAQWKALFFDRPAVQKAAGRMKVRALTRFGAYLRRVAQTSMRYRKKASPPGQPPSAHKSKRRAALKKMGRARHNGALLRELLFYAFDPKTQTVVVGPVGFGTKTPTVPELHEFGGTRPAEKGEKMPVKNPAGRDPKTGRFFSRGVHLVRLTGTVRFPKRPFMAPALQKTKAKFPEEFRNSLR